MAQQNRTAYIILGLLEHEDQSGYDLKKRIDSAISQFWDVGFGQIYPTLKKLEEDGDIVGKPVRSEKGPDRIVYSITAAGREKLMEWLNTPSEKEYVRYEILLKLFFGGISGPEVNTERIENFQNQYAQMLGQLQFYKTNLESVLKDHPDHLYYYLTVLFGEYIYKAYLAWALEALRLLTTQNSPATESSIEEEFPDS